MTAPAPADGHPFIPNPAGRNCCLTCGCWWTHHPEFTATENLDAKANDLANAIADEEMDRLEAATDQGPETRECPWCYGHGEIGTDRDYFGNWNTKPCWRCNGTGEIDL